MQTNPQSHLQPNKIDWHNPPCKQQPPSNSGAQQKWFSPLQQPYQPQTKLDHQLHRKQWPLMVIQVLGQTLQRQGYAQSQCYECCSKQTRQLAKPNPSFVTMKRRQDSARLAPHFDETVLFSHPFEDGVRWKHYAPHQMPQTVLAKIVTKSGSWSLISFCGIPCYATTTDKNNCAISLAVIASLQGIK